MENGNGRVTLRIQRADMFAVEEAEVNVKIRAVCSACYQQRIDDEYK